VFSTLQPLLSRYPHIPEPFRNTGRHRGEEIIRWHPPVLHSRCTTLADFELGGKTIRKGDKVAI